MKKLLLSVLAFSIGIMAYAQSVGINADGSTPDNSAILDVKANNKGLLVPRVALTGTTSAAPVVSPANALLVYNTATTADVTPGFYFWDAATTRWVRLLSGGTSSATAWDLTGNTGTNPASDFIGTTDAQDLVFRTNNTEKVRITDKGALEIGQNLFGNVFIGKDAGRNTDLSSGSSINPNTFIGFQAGYSNESGHANYFSGYQSGYSNVSGIAHHFSGQWAGYSNITGIFNHFVGYRAGYNNTRVFGI